MNNYPQGTPEHCWASQQPEVLEDTKPGYMTPEAHRLYAAASSPSSPTSCTINGGRSTVGEASKKTGLTQQTYSLPRVSKTQGAN
jgi:hypothetical protein